jgi:hypothetical protein
MSRNYAAILLSVMMFLAGCETLVAQRYSISAENVVAIKSLGVAQVGVGTFSGPPTFNASCRAYGNLELPDGVTPAQYIQHALEDELKIAGAYVQASPRVTLIGYITRLEFTSSQTLMGGSWTIDLDLISTNGHRMTVKEYYEFPSGFGAGVACRQTTDAFSRAVQNLIGKTVHSPEFALLVK